jgi:hypothetical protein
MEQSPQTPTHHYNYRSTTINETKDQQLQRITKIRALLEEAEQALAPIARRSEFTQGYYTYFAGIIITVITIILILPLMLTWYFVLMSLYYVTCNKYYFEFLQMTFNEFGAYLDHFIIVLLHPISSLNIIRKSRVIQAHASQITETKNTKMFLIPSRTMQDWSSFSKHEDVVKMLEVKEIKQIRTSIFGEYILFVSHKWLPGNNPDSSDNAIFQQVKDYLVNEPHEYVWFDYTCVPQAEESAIERNKMLLAIADILQRCRVEPFHVSSYYGTQYMHSVWCQLEAIALDRAYSYVPRNNQWTIYDKSDMYAIMPSFIEMVFSAKLRLQFVHISDRAKVFVDILRLFMEYHDKQVGFSSSLVLLSVEPLEIITNNGGNKGNEIV